MDTRNNVLIAAFYVVGILLVALIAVSYYASTDRSHGGLKLTWNLPTAGSESASKEQLPVGTKTRKPAAPPIPVAQPPRRELQTSLAVTRQMLEKRTAALNEKNEECKALKEELDQSFMLIVSLLTTDPDDPAANAGSVETRTKLQEEIDRLRASLARSEQLDAERQQQLTQLQADLIQADMELAAMQQQSQESIQALGSEKRVVEETTSTVFARCGMMVVPLVTDLLLDERVEIRRWAVQTLGTIGPEAAEALPDLQIMLSDPDQVVRDRAREAITAITGVAPANPR